MIIKDERNEFYSETIVTLSTFLNALSHPARLYILMHLAKYSGCQAGSISKNLPLAKSTVSEHLSKLKDMGLISCTSSGVCQNYKLNNEMVEQAKEYLYNFIKQIEDQKQEQIKCLVKEQFNSRFI